MRSDKFMGTALMVSIYGRKHDVIFKYVETTDITRTTTTNLNNPVTYFYVEVSYLFIYLVIMDLTS